MLPSAMVWSSRVTPGLWGALLRASSLARLTSWPTTSESSSFTIHGGSALGLDA